MRGIRFGRRFSLTVTLGLLSPLAWGIEISVGAPLPGLVIDSRGELTLQEGDFAYRPWTLPAALGKVHVLQYMAGRMSARNQTKPFTDRLESAIPDESIHVTTVINLDDTLWGTSGFVVGEVKSSKRKYPDSTIVLDETGAGLETWGLRPKGATIVILDPGGSVLYFKEGAMSEFEIDSTLELIRTYVASD